MPLIEQAHAESGGTYGARRITRTLRRKDVDVARCTVERLMAELGLEGVMRGRRRRTTIPEPSAPRPPDLVDRVFPGPPHPPGQPSQASRGPGPAAGAAERRPRLRGLAETDDGRPPHHRVMRLSQAGDSGLRGLLPGGPVVQDWCRRNPLRSVHRPSLRR
ncbi:MULTISPECIES: IS3 family transposase [unclassified Streptomyces]|uniref:IS3 family transposase n=1 Tax=unclassified Streptomyces TaxID=2593676 RepID=UPI003328D4A9